MHIEIHIPSLFFIILISRMISHIYRKIRSHKYIYLKDVNGEFLFVHDFTYIRRFILLYKISNKSLFISKSVM